MISFAIAEHTGQARPMNPTPALERKSAEEDEIPFDPIIPIIQIEKRIHHVVEKVLFLRIDGVICPQYTYNQIEDLARSLFPDTAKLKRYHMQYAAAGLFDENAVRCLQDLVTTFPDMHIVLSCDWRLGGSMSDLTKIFKKYAFITDRLIDRTDYELSEEEQDWRCDREMVITGTDPIEFFRTRGCNIEAWLDRHPTVRNYVIMDDYGLGKKSTLWDRYVDVDAVHLLTESDVEKAKVILTKEVPEQPLRPSEDVLIVHAIEVIEQLLCRKMTPRLLKRCLKILIKYAGEKISVIAPHITDRASFLLKRDKQLRISLLLKYAEKKNAAPILLRLFDDKELSANDMMAFFLRLSEQEITRAVIPLILENTNISLNKKEECLLLLVELNTDVMRLLLLHGESISPSCKNLTLMKLIGIRGMLSLVFRKNDRASTLQELVSEKFQGKEEIKSIIELLLTDGEVDAEGKCILSQELSKIEGMDSFLIDLLNGKAITPEYRGRILCNLSGKVGREKVMEALLPVDDIDPKYRKSALFSLSGRRGMDDFIRQLIKPGDIDSHSRGCALSNLSNNEGTEDIMKILLQPGDIHLDYIIKAFCNLVKRNGSPETMLCLIKDGYMPPEVRAKCLVTVIGKEKVENVIDALYRGKGYSVEEHRIFLSKIISHLKGSKKEIQIFPILIKDVMLDSDLQGELLTVLAARLNGEQPVQVDERQTLEEMMKVLLEREMIPLHRLHLGF